MKLANSADPCERRPKVASHRGLSCLLTINRRPLDRSAYWKIFSLFLTQTYVVGTQNNRLIEYRHQEHGWLTTRHTSISCGSRRFKEKDLKFFPIISLYICQSAQNLHATFPLPYLMNLTKISLLYTSLKT